MTDPLFNSIPSRPELPEPQRERWQPLRIGLIELFHYDSEEFWFHDGHLLLRGNNGTGKSKVLSLSLPFLFDAQLRSSRIEPDGDNGKKMAWNLLMNSYQRRIGYTWIEFGRRMPDGAARYLTLGAGLSAVTGRTQVDSWFFLLEGATEGSDPRIGKDIWLTSEQRVVFTRERLREAIEGQGRGKVFETAHNYRKAVDERLFQLGVKRYEALMDTLIQLRQPQLSKKPDEAGLSHALTEALPPMLAELLADVAEALNQLEEDRNRLEETRQLEQAVRHFEQRYRSYASTLTRRQARELRQAQTGFDTASEERNKAHIDLQQAQANETDARNIHEAAKRTWGAARELHETLLADPANQDANRLSQAEKDANERQKDAIAAGKLCQNARQNLLNEETRSRRASERVETARHNLASKRRENAAEAEIAGISRAYADSPLACLATDMLANFPEPELATSAAALSSIVAGRREQIRLLQRRHNAVAAIQLRLQSRQSTRGEYRADAEDAAERRAAADLHAENAGNQLIDAWNTYCGSLIQLRFDASGPLEQLASWTTRPEGINPIHTALTAAHGHASVRHANRQSQLTAQQESQHRERISLVDERERLAAGQDTAPPQPHTRTLDAREGRAGAPLWQLVDFQPHVGIVQRAGLEAALEGCGLLDAWIAPDGVLTDAGGTPLLDSQWSQRPPAGSSSLADFLLPAAPDDDAALLRFVELLLAGVACGSHAMEAAEAWIAPDGRYRLGALAGAWHKTEAVYIGHAARARARQQRLDEISRRLEALDTEDRMLARHVDNLKADRQHTENEWLAAPSDTILRTAVLTAVAAQREVLAAQQRLSQAEAQCQEAEAELQSARKEQSHDATDLQLPANPEDLPPVADALDRFNDAQHQLVQSAREWRNAWPEQLQQQERETEAREALAQRKEALSISIERTEAAQARHTALLDSIGGQVEMLRQKLAEAADTASQTEQDAASKHNVLIAAGQTRAVAATHAEAADKILTERTDSRTQAIERLQRFTASSLLASALPGVALPEGDAPWTIDPALNLARRAEQALANIPDDDISYSRIQRQVSEDLTELQRTLSALGHQATSEPNDWGFTVHILYQNRPERPDTLSARLAEDIAQRSELLSAKEREVLENHLQAEIASEIQRLMRAADMQVSAINDELHKRPTSTGVRYRLQWQPLTPEEGAPVGLDIARERLLHTSSDLWSVDDRRVVGAMLQQQIVMERARADADPSAPGGNLIDQLARALDYRRWHRFRVQRQQDGQWRKLSGPASSGERALGLTVPLFAAISSFYGRGASPFAPRLMLLDEAFAGIDDTARAHCMGLVREFDLDFVITSEREWACYAELPGVAICQLQRREGVDAVFVSRWTWDGRAKRREDDPDRRFPAT